MNSSRTCRLRSTAEASPPVIIIHEIPGITPGVAAFARRVADHGLTVVLPDLLGTPGRPMTIPDALSSFAHACISKEFTLLALNKTSPIVDYLRDLAKHEHGACGGPGVGAPVFDGVARRELRFAGHDTRDSDTHHRMFWSSTTSTTDVRRRALVRSSPGAAASIKLTLW
jgi:hypothetical protein